MKTDGMGAPLVPMPWDVAGIPSGKLPEGTEPEPIPIDRHHERVSRRRESEPLPPPSPRGEIVLPYRTPLEIAASTSEHPDWIVPGFVALGAVTEIDGKVKSSGKTTLVTYLNAAVLDGQPFLGQPTMKTSIVYLTEQTPGPFREALARANLLGRGPELRVIFRAEVTGVSWLDLVRQVAIDAKRDGYGLLVVDTLGKLAGIREENDAGESGRVMSPLQDAAHDGLAVIVCRHDRKGGGDVGESGRGSSAFSGDADIILQIRRPEGNQPKTRRVIESLSRYTETPEKIVVELTDEGYILLGEAEAVSLADALKFVSGLLGRGNDRNESGPTIDEMVVEADGALDRSAIRRALRELERRAEIGSTGRGVKGDPKRYRPREMDSGLTHGVSDRNGIGAGS